MNKTEKDTSRQCNHNYEYIKTFVTKSGGEFVKIYKCTKCGKGCEKRTNRMGSRPRNPIIL